MASILYAQYMSGKLSLPDLKEKAKLKHAAIYRGLDAQGIGQHVSSYLVRHKSGKNIAVMPVIGTLTKRGEMCSYGMQDYMDELTVLNNNADVHSIVLDMEGPGGTVDGTPEFGQAVKQSKKPVVTFGDNMVASANYWVASQSRFIIGNKNNPTEFGSIGVLAVHEYWGKFIEENIGEIKIIRAPQSTDKARVNPIEQLTPELEAEIVADLKGLAKDFHATVKKGRGAKLTASEKDWGTGRMYKNAEAIGLGLIDAEGTLMDAIGKAAEFAMGTMPDKKNANAQGAHLQITNKKNMNTKEVARRVSSFFAPKKAAVKAAEPAAAEGDVVPMWTAEMVFNTDGTADGALCMHADTDGTDRQFETKVDNNTGNEPPTDPAITEDDNWAAVAEGEAAAPIEAAPIPGASILKLNKALKASQIEVKTLKAQVTELLIAKKALQDEKIVNAKKPAAAATTVVGEADPNSKREAKTSWEKKAARKVGMLKDLTS